MYPAPIHLAPLTLPPTSTLRATTSAPHLALLIFVYCEPAESGRRPVVIKPASLALVEAVFVLVLVDVVVVVVMVMVMVTGLLLLLQLLLLL